jgi:uncharacterized surface anchored protein
VFAGSYSVTEDDPSADNFALTDIDCSASDTEHGSSVTPDLANRTVDFDLAAQDTVECTFTNTLQTGAIEITKTRKHAADGSGDHPHAGVDFTIEGGILPSGGTTVQTDANGMVCLDGLVFDDYTVTESVPSGYMADGATSKDVTVSAVSTCGDGNEATVSFGNTPLTDLDVIVDSQVPGGTSSDIECRNEADEIVASGGPGDDITAGVDGLLPGTYVCTVIIDP